MSPGCGVHPIWVHWHPDVHVPTQVMSVLVTGRCAQVGYDQWQLGGRPSVTTTLVSLGGRPYAMSPGCGGPVVGVHWHPSHTLTFQ